MSRRTLMTMLVPALVVGIAVLVVLAIWAGLPARQPKPSPTPTPNTAIHAFPELEARLPDEVAGNRLDKVSLHSDPEAQVPKTLEVLRRLNKLPTDLQLAKASATGVDITVSAFRIIGADAIRAIAAFEQVDEADPESHTTYAPATVGGKRVVKRTTGIVVEYVYPIDDVMFVISGDIALVEDALGKVH